MFRLSVRHLLLLFALFAIACMVLRSANSNWCTALSGFTLLVFMAAAVVALVDRGSRQAFAIGFVVCASIYATLFAMAPKNRELDPYEGKFPTTRLMQPLFVTITTARWLYADTGEEIQKYDPSDPSFVGLSVIHSESPSRENFMSVAHLLWTLLFGYVGGHFGRFVYLRRK